MLQSRGFRGLIIAAAALIAVTLIQLPALAAGSIVDSGSSGSVSWTLDADGVLTFTGTGMIEEDFSYDYRVKSVVIKSGITGIDDNTFKSCEELEAVTFPSGLQSIGQSAFYKCTSLQRVDLPDTVTSVEQYAFRGCYGLESVKLSKGLSEISFGAFDYCTSLQSIDIPGNVVEIWMYAFRGCSALKTVTLHEGLENLGSAFPGCTSLTTITLPSTVTTARILAFEGCTSLASVNVASGNTEYASLDGMLFDKYFTHLMMCPEGITGTRELPDGLTTIDKEACFGCTKLQGLTIPHTVTTIGDDAFYNCGALTCTVEEGSFAESYCRDNGIAFTSVPATAGGINYSLDNGKLTITGTGEVTDKLFYERDDILEVVIKAGITGIGDRAFAYCENLKKVTLPNTLTRLGEVAFASTAITTITVPESVDDIGDCCFEGCEQLVTVNLPTTASTMSAAFRGCSSLKRVVVPYGVQYLHSFTFYNCTALEEVILPDTITLIGEYAFRYCHSLKHIDLPDSLRSIGQSAFEDCFSLSGDVNIPEGFTDLSPICIFQNCRNLDTISLPSTLSASKMCLATFGGCDKVIFRVPAGAYELLEWFENCDGEGLRYVIKGDPHDPLGKNRLSLPASTRTVGAMAFMGTSAEIVVIPYGCKSISSQAFANNSRLCEVYIPDTVTSIADDAFKGCSGFTIITGDSDYIYDYAVDHNCDVEFRYH